MVAVNSFAANPDLVDTRPMRKMSPSDAINALIDDTLDAADTLRFVRVGTSCAEFNDEVPTDPDATSIYDIALAPVRYVGRRIRRHGRGRRRKIRETQENILRLREALAEGWDIAPELAHEQRRLAVLEAA